MCWVGQINLHYYLRQKLHLIIHQGKYFKCLHDTPAYHVINWSALFMPQFYRLVLWRGTTYPIKWSLFQCNLKEYNKLEHFVSMWYQFDISPGIKHNGAGSWANQAEQFGCYYLKSAVWINISIKHRHDKHWKKIKVKNHERPHTVSMHLFKQRS